MGKGSAMLKAPLLIAFQDIRCLHPVNKPFRSNLQNLFGRSRSWGLALR